LERQQHYWTIDRYVELFVDKRAYRISAENFIIFSYFLLSAKPPY